MKYDFLAHSDYSFLAYLTCCNQANLLGVSYFFIYLILNIRRLQPEGRTEERGVPTDILFYILFQVLTIAL